MNSNVKFKACGACAIKFGNFWYHPCHSVTSSKLAKSPENFGSALLSWCQIGVIHWREGDELGCQTAAPPLSYSETFGATHVALPSLICSLPVRNNLLPRYKSWYHVLYTWSPHQKFLVKSRHILRQNLSNFATSIFFVRFWQFCGVHTCCTCTLNTKYYCYF